MDEISKKRIENIISLMAVGDVMLGRKVSQRIEEESPGWVFAEVKNILKKADLVIGNLESPLIDYVDQPASQSEVVLRAPEKAARSLQSANFSVMNVGNNHIMDYGEKGLMTTFKTLESQGIRYIGAGLNEREARRPLKVNVSGLNLAFFSYCASYNATATKAGTAPLNINSIRKDINAQKEDSDIIFVSLHHGVEYSDYPMPGFMKLCRAVIDAGADVILGHHPHVLQGIENYKGKLIAYSLGNFVFDLADEAVRQRAYRDCLLARRYGVKFERDDNRVSESMILKIELDRDGFLDYRVHPIFIKPDFRPVPLDGIESNKILQRIEDLSKNIGNDSLAMNQILERLEADSALDYLKNREITYYFRRLGKLRFDHLRLMAHVIKAKLTDISLFRRR